MHKGTGKLSGLHCDLENLIRPFIQVKNSFRFNRGAVSCMQGQQMDQAAGGDVERNGPDWTLLYEK